MRIGFTGTRLGMTAAQRKRFLDLFGDVEGELHHGDAVGADAAAHGLALELGLSVIIHPPEIDSQRAWCEDASFVHEPRPYLVRNRDIVRDTDCLVAAPAGRAEELRSGTWATVRFARRLRRPIWIIYPNGTYVTEYRARCPSRSLGRG
jgi:hypothetical protein